jgi:hypothetical protein
MAQVDAALSASFGDRGAQTICRWNQRGRHMATQRSRVANC